MPESTACNSPHVFDIIAEEHALLRELCDLMEAIADGLPFAFDAGRARVAISLLQGALPAHTRLEDELLFPLIEKRFGATHPVSRAIACLNDDHRREAALVAEVTEALNAVMMSERHVNLEALGYMMRALFDVLRRHIDFEDMVVLPAARDVITDADMRDMQGWIMRGDRPRCCRQSFMTLRAVKIGVCVTCPDAVRAGTQTH